MLQKSFFSDQQFEYNKIDIDTAFNLIPDNVTVIIPSDGLGTGLAQLPTRAPKTYQYILKKIKEL